MEWWRADSEYGGLSLSKVARCTFGGGQRDASEWRILEPQLIRADDIIWFTGSGAKNAPEAVLGNRLEIRSHRRASLSNEMLAQVAQCKTYHY